MSEVRTGPAVAAIIAPFLVAIAGAGAWFAIAGGVAEVISAFQEGGWATYAAFAVTAPATLVIAIVGFLMARGQNLPLVLPIGIAVLPWAIGTAGLLIGLQMVSAALAVVEPSDASILMAAGVAECFQARVLGAYFSAVLLLEAASILAIAALGSPSRRVVLLMGAAVVASAGVLALVDTLAVRSLARGMGAMAMVDPSVVGAILAPAVAEAALWKLGVVGAMTLAAGAAVAHVVTAFMQRRSPGGVADAILVAAALGAVVGFDAFGAASARAAAGSLSASGGPPGFEFTPAPRTFSNTARLDGFIDRASVPLPDLGLARLNPGPEGRVGIALDHRLARAAIDRVFEVLRQRGVVEVALFGETRVISEAALSALGADASLIAPLAQRRSAVWVSLAGEATAEDLLAEVSGGRILTVSSRAGPSQIDTDDPAPKEDGEGRRVLLRLRDPAGVKELMNAADALSRRGFEPVVMSREPAAPPAQERIRIVVEESLPAFRRCYEERLKRNPRLAGKVVVEFDIGSAGDVVRAALVSSEMDAPPVERCLLGVMQSLRFSAGDSVTVRYPFIFRPSE